MPTNVCVGGVTLAQELHNCVHIYSSFEPVFSPHVTMQANHDSVNAVLTSSIACMLCNVVVDRALRSTCREQRGGRREGRSLPSCHLQRGS